MAAAAWGCGGGKLLFRAAGCNKMCLYILLLHPPQFSQVLGGRHLFGCVWCTVQLFCCLAEHLRPSKSLLSWGHWYIRLRLCAWLILLKKHTSHFFFFGCKLHTYITCIINIFGEGERMLLGFGKGGVTSLQLSESWQKFKNVKTLFLSRLETQIVNMQRLVQQFTWFNL